MEFLHKITSGNDKISYTIVWLNNQYGNSLYCGYYVSDVFDSNTGILWHCDDENITQISDNTRRGFYYRETQKNWVIWGSTDVLFVVYIRKRHLIRYIYIFFKNLPTCPKSIISFFLLVWPPRFQSLLIMGWCSSKTGS